MAMTRTALVLAGVLAVVVTISVSVLIAAAVIDTESLPSELPAGVELVYKSFIVPGRGAARGEAVCPVGKVVTGGGPYTNAVNSTLLLLDSYPLPADDHSKSSRAWRVRFSSKAPDAVSAGVVAVCVSASSRAARPRRL